MSRKKKEDPLDYLTLPALNIDPEIKKNIFALFLLLTALVCALGLFDSAGAAGVYLREGLTWLLGWGRWLAPLVLLAWSMFIFFKEKLAISLMNYVGLFLLSLSLQSFLQLIISQDQWSSALLSGAGGGHIGWLAGLGLVKAIGTIAAFLATLFFFLIGLMFTFNTTLAHIMAKGSAPAKFFLHPFKFLLAKIWPKKTGEEASADEVTADEEEEEPEEAEEEEIEEEAEEAEEEEDEEHQDEPEHEERHAPVAMAAKPAKAEVLNIWQPTNVQIDLPLELLSKKIGKPLAGDVKNNREIIRMTLSKFGIEAEMGDICVGPTVAQYTLRPAEGIKLSRITDLSNNLAMALAAHPIRIEAPIPGKALVGIEVPNRTIATVGLREILGSPDFAGRNADTMISLGKDVTGKVWLANLTKMPHLLVAGTTGSGKSVMLNTIIVSLLYQNNPDNLRFIMVDPKRVELTMYNGIPHLLTPVITEVSKTVNALKWCLNELDRRLRILEQAKKRDIASFNQVSKQKMPYIVFIIDELADLMLVAGKDVETAIVRLAQLSRAVGIHLILATQRPSVNIITGTIKANMPARIAFAVASSIDSRTILDCPGAEKLLGKGDMLFSDQNTSKPKRIQGAYISDQEIKRIVNQIKAQSDGVEYLDGVIERQRVQGAAGVGMDGGSDDDDEVINQAAEIILTTGKCSVTFLQRKLSIGYPRAAKLVDQLEEMGIVGPGNGAKPRELLMTLDEWQSQRNQGPASAPLHNRETAKAPAQYLESEEAPEAEAEEEDGENFFNREELADEEEFIGEEAEAEDEALAEEPEEEIDNEDSTEDEESAEDEEGESEDTDEEEIIEDESDESSVAEAMEDEEEDEEIKEEENPPKKKTSRDFDRYFSR